MRILAAFGASVLLAWVLGHVIGLFAIFVGIAAFLIACTLLLKPSPPPSPDDVPLGGALIASLVLGAAAAPLARRWDETKAEAGARRLDTMVDVAGKTADLAATGVELGAAYVGNVIDTLTDD